MPEITLLLQRAIQGEPQAREQLYALVYDELTRLARRSLAQEATVSQLDPNSLVHEAYLKLESRGDLSFENRRAFFGYAARVMRSVVLDTLRERLSAKRGGGRVEVSLNSSFEDSSGQAADLFAVDHAMKTLAGVDARCHDIFEMHYFGGMSVKDVCGAMELSSATIKRELRKARAWLTDEIGGGTAPA